MSYTPGPWEAPEVGAGCLFRVCKVGGATICDIYCVGKDGKVDLDQSDANARLIAAAPDLLEAVKRLLAPESIGYIRRRDEIAGPIFSSLIAAIAKAEDHR